MPASLEGVLKDIVNSIQRDFLPQGQERLCLARTEIIAHSRATILPGEGGSRQRRLQIRGQEQPSGVTPSNVLTIEIAPEYFATLALGILKERDFAPTDGTPS